MSLSAHMDMETFVWVVLLEWKQNVGPTKMGGSTQIRSRDLALGALLELL